jgi:hypothetical protein
MAETSQMRGETFSEKDVPDDFDPQKGFIIKPSSHPMLHKKKERV